MIAVYKFALPVEDYATVPMHRGARVLAVQEQRGAPFVWALVDTEAELEARRFRVVGTGHEFLDADECQTYVGTFQLLDGALVLHVFTDYERGS